MATQAEATTRVIDGVEYPPAGTYVLDAAHTRLGFAVRHMAVSKVRGGLNTFEGTLVVGEDPALDGQRFRRTANGVCLITQKMIARLEN